MGGCVLTLHYRPNISKNILSNLFTLVFRLRQDSFGRISVFAAQAKTFDYRRPFAWPYLEQILKMFYDSAQFGVPPFFTEFGDRLKQLSNEYTSMSGTYSINQRLLYGKNVVSRRCYNMVPTVSNVVSKNGNKVSSRSDYVDEVEANVVQSKVVQPSVFENISMSTEETSNILDQTQQNTNVSESNEISSPLQSPAQQIEPELPQKDVAFSQPKGRDACSINQTIRAHIGKRKRREPVSLHQRLKHSLLAPQTVQMIASMANENNHSVSGEALPNAEDPLFSCLGDNLERYVDQENLQHLLSNNDNDDWFKDFNFDELENVDYVAENLTCDPQPSTSANCFVNSITSEHANQMEEIVVDDELNPECSFQPTTLSPSKQPFQQLRNKRTSWKLVALSPIKRPLKYYSRNPSIIAPILEPVNKDTQLPNTTPVKIIKSPAKKKKKKTPKKVMPQQPLPAHQAAVKDHLAVASFTQTIVEPALYSASGQPNECLNQPNECLQSHSQVEVSAEELDRQMRITLQDLLAPKPHLERPAAPQISLSLANSNFVLSQPTRLLSSLSQKEWSSTSGTRGERAERREREKFCLVAANTDPVFYSCSSTSSSVSENVEPSQTYNRRTDRQKCERLNKPSQLLSKPDVATQNKTPEKQLSSGSQELTMEDGEISSPVLNENVKDDHHSCSTTFTEEDDEDGLIISYDPPTCKNNDKRRGSTQKNSDKSSHYHGQSRREQTNHRSPERKASSRHADTRQRVMRDSLTHSSSSARCRSPPKVVHQSIAPYSVIFVDPKEISSQEVKESRYDQRQEKSSQSSQRCSSSRIQSRYSPQKRSGSSRRNDSPKKRNNSSRRPVECEEQKKYRRPVPIRPSAAPKRPPV
uniref:Uncharacterized protein n=1 Tax=Ditylenchus dipsaci TaxID=166011 RepID=A0A915CN78_9BILA